VAPGSPELRPPTALVSTGASQGAGEGEWDAGSSVGGSPGRERWWGGRASRRRGGGRETWWGVFRRGRGEGRSSVRGEMLQGLSGAFIGAGGTGRVAGVTAVVNGDYVH
jgi:hypothetical protein